MATVLLLGNLRASLTLARSLARAGHRIVAGMDAPDPYLFLSRHVAHVFPHAPLDVEPDAALEAVTAAIAREDVDVILPVSEVATRLVAREAERLGALVQLALPDPALVKRCTDKAGLFEACEGAGVPLAKRRIVASVDGLHAAALEVGGPLIVKPTDSTAYVLGRKAVVLDTPDAARDAFTAWPADHQTLCVQRFVDGPRLNVYFAAVDGQLIGAVPVQIGRTDALDGTGYALAGRSIKPGPDLRRATETLIAHLGYHGVGCAQFMQSSDGTALSFLETNPRLGANYKIAEACGLRLSELALDLPLGAQPAIPSDAWAFKTGVHYAWTKGAISGALKAKRAGDVGWAGFAGLMAQTAREALAPCHLTFDPTDPLPTLGAYANIVLAKLMARRGIDGVTEFEARP